MSRINKVQSTFNRITAFSLLAIFLTAGSAIAGEPVSNETSITEIAVSAAIPAATEAQFSTESQLITEIQFTEVQPADLDISLEETLPIGDEDFMAWPPGSCSAETNPVCQNCPSSLRTCQCWCDVELNECIDNCNGASQCEITCEYDGEVCLEDCNPCHFC